MRQMITSAGFSLFLLALSYFVAFKTARYIHKKRGLGLAGYWYILALGWLAMATVCAADATGLLK